MPGGGWRLAGWVAIACAVPALLLAVAEARERQHPLICEAFIDELDALDRGRWLISDGWSNGGMFNAGWRRENARLADGHLTLVLDDRPASGRLFSAGEVQSRRFAGYGRFEVRMKPARGVGTVSAFFIYTGPSHGDPMDEVDIEFLGKDTTVMQTNYFTNGEGGKETLIPLGFDAADSFNDYAIDWHPDAIRWYVNGRLVHEERGARGPLPTHPGKIIASLWNGTGVDDWLGPFAYPGRPLAAIYDRIAFTPLPGNPGCGGDRR